VGGHLARCAVGALTAKLRVLVARSPARLESLPSSVWPQAGGRQKRIFGAFDANFGSDTTISKNLIPFVNNGLQTKSVSATRFKRSKKHFRKHNVITVFNVDVESTIPTMSGKNRQVGTQ
jgi:hypothetical protein